MTTILLVTHPEAQHHVEGLVGGWYDSALTARGRRQARAIADALGARLGGTAPRIVSSDLARTRQTAEMIGTCLGAPVELDPDLREKSYGEAEGRPKSWQQQRQIPLPDKGERLDHDEGIPGAETRLQLAVRAYHAMERIVASDAETHIVVTHGGTATLLIAAWIEMPLESAGRVQFGVSSGGITTLRKNPWNHSHMVAQLNDTAHLSR